MSLKYIFLKKATKIVLILLAKVEAFFSLLLCK